MSSCQLEGNGWPARTTNWLDLVDSIEDVLNKNNPNSKLAKMSEESIKIAKRTTPAPIEY